MPEPTPPETKPKPESFKVVSPITLGDTVKTAGSTVTVDELNEHNIIASALVTAGVLKGGGNG